MYFFQCDLEGADGWPVAAHCAACGDRTMLDDYLAGLKPAKIIASAYTHGSAVMKLDRNGLKSLCSTVDKDGWLYMGCKRVYHGTNYGMQPQTMSDQLLKDSYKMSGEPIYIAPAICAKLQQLCLQRWPGILTWHRICESKLKQTGRLTSVGGHTRYFLGRRDDHGTWKEYLADEPQETTTYVTKRALHALWYDPENRSSDGSLRIEPLLTVHDALCGQFAHDDTDWAVARIRTYFDNPITVAGFTFTIPFDGAYGPSWGELINKI